MSNNATRFVTLAAAAALLGACAAGTAGSDRSAAVAAAPAQAAAAPEEPAKPRDVHEASAQCWMKYDKSKESLEAKAKLVDKCIDEKMK
ncbi:MAG: hypothetical protein JO205_01490 [Pseudolabrys sp.]|nr:hypothetical protein [Pseudolabrys sp.]